MILNFTSVFLLLLIFNPAMIECFKTIPYKSKIKVSRIFMSSTTYGPIIVGGGPTGLSTAIMLAKRGMENIKVYERLPEYIKPDDNLWLTARSYIIGINGRGQNFLKWLDVMEKIDKQATVVVGRKDWSPETDIDNPKEIMTNPKEKSYFTKCIQRDRLAACLLEEIYNNYKDKISVEFNVSCIAVNWENENMDTETCKLTFTKNLDGEGNNIEFIESSKFVIGADGAGSIIRDVMEEKKENKFAVTKFDDKNVRVYKTIPLFFPPNNKKWRKDLNYSVRTKSDINLDALPTKEGTYLGVVLFRPWDTRLANINDLAQTKALFKSVFPMFTEVVKDEDLEEFGKKEPSKLPKFMFCGPVLHKGKTTCLLGDTIHTVKPYFGQGVNSAFEDVKVLNDALEECNNNIPNAIKLFSKKRAKDVKALVKISKKLDGGFLTFVLPLIIDGILHKLAPSIFNPNYITMLQNERLTFSQVKYKKRKDRILQLILLTGALSLSFKIISLFLNSMRVILFSLLNKKFIF